jgi:hypothetical protein
MSLRIPDSPDDVEGVDGDASPCNVLGTTDIDCCALDTTDCAWPAATPPRK